jgi:SPP1 gp7 family putative phage head morphogenesis protein
VARLKALRREINQLIVTDDDFGLGPSSTTIRTNARFAFETSANKVQRFSAWLDKQIKDGVLAADTKHGADPFTVTYIRSTYRQAAMQAYIQSRPELQADSVFFKGSQAEFLREAFDSPIPQDRIQLLATRTFENLKGITSKMSTDLNRIFADGVSQQKSPRYIARQITKEIDSIQKTRALRLARTEIVHAYAEGSLDSYERLGVEELGVDVEWSTAGDDKVCDKCQAKAGTVYTIDKARGLIPFHPNCRCAWIPAFRKPIKRVKEDKAAEAEAKPSPTSE